MNEYEERQSLQPGTHRVVVGNAPQPLDASLLQMELEANDITSEQEGEYTLAVDPILSNAIGGIRIVVAEEDAEKAREVLKDYYQRRMDDASALERTCPECRATNAKFIKRPFLFAILLVATLGVFNLLFRWPRFECEECGHRWR
ncbi:MAG: DUF2007 domain-containing protein [Verrucomicrobia bacterium]|nr:DUF2007 domain-containing protein [Verrucomicrobiota bacterium]MCH8510921.1 DUF2007 domain-containing protein [Kiritimatiellia bacterium]